MHDQTFVDWCLASSEKLEEMMRTSPAPELETLVGFEWDGWTNYILSPWKKFRKGFINNNGQVVGYNLRMVSNDINDYWLHMPQKKPFGFFKVTGPNKNQRANLYPNAAVIDYHTGLNDLVSSSTKDYIVALDDPEKPTIVLGKMYFVIDEIFDDVIKQGLKLFGKFLPAHYKKVKDRSFVNSKVHVLPNYFILKKAERICKSWQETIIQRFENG